MNVSRSVSRSVKLLLAITCLAGWLQTPVHAQCDPQGQWAFDEGAGLVAADSAGGNDGALTNMGEDAWTAGRVGSGALTFDGVDDHVIFASGEDAAVYDTFSDYSWSVWIRTTEPGGFMAKGPPSDVSWDHDDYRGGRALFVTGGGTLTADVGWVGALGTGVAVNDGEWHHVAKTVEFNTDADNDTMKLYIDGGLAGEKSDWDINAQVPNAPGGGVLKVGNVSSDFPRDGLESFPGDIDEVRVYGCALSAEEVAVLALGIDDGEATPVPALEAWGQVFLLSLFLGGGALLLRGRRWRFREA